MGWGSREQGRLPPGHGRQSEAAQDLTHLPTRLRAPGLGRVQVTEGPCGSVLVGTTLTGQPEATHTPAGPHQLLTGEKRARIPDAGHGCWEAPPAGLWAQVAHGPTPH